MNFHLNMLYKCENTPFPLFLTSVVHFKNVLFYLRNFNIHCLSYKTLSVRCFGNATFWNIQLSKYMQKKGKKEKKAMHMKNNGKGFQIFIHSIKEKLVETHINEKG